MARIILHVDFNSFFASVEQQANPFLRGKAIAITGKRGAKDMRRSIVATASREAKRMGVKTTMSVYEARRVCPELILLPGDMRKYSEITKRMMTVLRQYAEIVEQFSTDEAFADITHTAHDYFGAAFIGQMIRADLKHSCGECCTASIGIGPNTLVAKLASGTAKPSGMNIVRPNDVLSFLDHQPLGELCGIGKATEEHLERLGILSFGALRTVSKDLLVREFKEVMGTWLYNSARGIGKDTLQEASAPKSYGHSYTFPFDLETNVELQTNLLALCDNVARRLRKNGVSACLVSVIIRYHDFSADHGQMRTEPLQDGLAMYKNAWSILERVRDPQKFVRLLGVSASAIQPINARVSLFSKDKKMQRTLQACDCIADQFGEQAVVRAATMKTCFHERASGFCYDHER